MSGAEDSDGDLSTVGDEDLLDLLALGGGGRGEGGGGVESGLGDVGHQEGQRTGGEGGKRPQPDESSREMVHHWETEREEGHDRKKVREKGPRRREVVVGWSKEKKEKEKEAGAGGRRQEAGGRRQEAGGRKSSRRSSRRQEEEEKEKEKRMAPLPVRPLGDFFFFTGKPRKSKEGETRS